jgi:hypothetical protein
LLACPGRPRVSVRPCIYIYIYIYIYMSVFSGRKYVQAYVYAYIQNIDVHIYALLLRLHTFASIHRPKHGTARRSGVG